MKKLFSVIMIAAAMLAACSDDDKEPVNPPETEDGLVFVEDGVHYLGNGDKEYDVPAGSYTLDASITYVIRGWVYITDGATVTIPAGTLLKGKSTDQTVKGSSIIVEPGGKLIAQGTATQPIVFTSDKEPGQRKPGDWGGIIICGKAPNNQTEMQIEGGPRTMHGGNDANDNSGVFSYCRIEFAGYPFDEDKEINGLTMGSVGKGTKIDHVQVSYCNDDSFEWFGGTVDCSHLIAYHGWDDDFDTDNGYSGTLQFLLGIRHPKLGDTSISNGFESDNWSNGTAMTPLTSARFCNVTLIGPIGQDDNFQNLAGTGNYIDAGELWPSNGSKVGQFQAGVQMRRGSNISLANSVIIGWPVGIMIDNDKGSATQSNVTAQSFQNIFMGGYTDNAIGSYTNQVGAAPILGSDRNKSFGDWFNNLGEASDADQTRSSVG
ncbi:MAG: hypothetical protein LIO77_09080, partial [Rikenellaceae bacterium]|nr:hypothetical protein [Rikenellaceae bacterium]